MKEKEEMAMCLKAHLVKGALEEEKRD